MQPKVYIITLNYNQSHYTIDCINSVLDSHYNNYKVLLIDNGSTIEDYDKLFLALPVNDQLHVSRIEKNCGYVGGINFGFSLIDQTNDAEYIMIMNNDTILDKQAIASLVDTCKSFSNKALVSGKVYDYEHKDVLQEVGAVLEDKNLLKFKHLTSYTKDEGQFDMVAQRDMMDDIFWLFHKDLYKAIGKYDTLFFFNGESADFAMRAQKAGFKLIYTPQAKLWHKGSVSVGGRKENPFINYWQMRSTLTFRYLHIDKKYFRKFVFVKIKQILFSYLRYCKMILKNEQTSIQMPNARLRGFIHFFTQVKKQADQRKSS